MPRRTGRRCRGADGQAAIELALALPLVLVVLLAIAQFGVVLRNHLALQHAAREGARAAAVSSDPERAAHSAIDRAVDLDVDVELSSSTSTVTVTVTYRDPTDVAFIGAAIGPITLTTSATMALEPP